MKIVNSLYFVSLDRTSYIPIVVQVVVSLLVRSVFHVLSNVQSIANVVLSSNRLKSQAKNDKNKPVGGIEPSTCRLRSGCSTTELCGLPTVKNKQLANIQRDLQYYYMRRRKL